MLNDSIRYHLVKNVLNLLNEKFTEHGLRVAYIMLKMCEYEGSKPDTAMRKLLELCILHDIGAYSTEEVKDMLRFETTTTMHHSAYGYLFLKYLTYLSEDADIILHHHLKYQDKDKYSGAFLAPALRIHLADRVDICNLNSSTEEEVLDNIQRLSGICFDPADVELFFRANEAYRIIKHLREEQKGEKQFYEEELIAFYSRFPYEFDEIIEVLKILVYSIDFRSEQTVIHTISTAIISQFLGRQFQVSEQVQNDLYFGALLHDIGKIAVPVEILESPGRLTAEEMQIMREHVVETEKIISDCVPEPIVRIAVRHHERNNGSGYPKGLMGDRLTLPEKIVATSDVFSALAGRRSYKDKMNREEIFTILHKMVANQEFDKEIVEMLWEHYDEVIEEIQSAATEIIEKYESLKKDYLDMLNSKGEGVLLPGNNLFSDFSTA